MKLPNEKIAAAAREAKRRLENMLKEISGRGRATT